MDDLYVPQIFTVKIQLDPIDMNLDFETTIKNEVITKYGDHCYINGFIQKHSIEFIRISNGIKIGSHLHGCLTFTVEFSARCCVPRTNTIIPCTVQKTNKFGVMAHVYPIDVIIPRQLQSTHDINLLENLNTGAVIILHVHQHGPIIRQQADVHDGIGCVFPFFWLWYFYHMGVFRCGWFYYPD